MKNFKELLEEFDKTLRQFNQDNYHMLQPPLPDKEVEKLLKSIGIEDENVYALYKWKNGVSNESALSMIFEFGCTMCSLEKVVQIATYNYFEFTKVPGILMLFNSPYGESLLFNSNAGKDYGKLHLYSVSLLSIENPYAYYDSLASMIETTIQQYKKEGLVFDNEEKFLNEDTEVNRKIYDILNPISDFYNHETW